MKLFGTDVTFEIGKRTQSCYLSLFSHHGKTIAVVSNFPSAGTNQFIDDADTLAVAIRTQWNIPGDNFTFVVYFPGEPGSDLQPWFSLFEEGTSVFGVPGTVHVAGRVLRLSPEELSGIIGEDWTNALEQKPLPDMRDTSQSIYPPGMVPYISGYVFGTEIGDIVEPVRDAIYNLRFAASLTDAPTEEDRTAFLDAALKLEMWMRRER